MQSVRLARHLKIIRLLTGETDYDSIKTRLYIINYFFIFQFKRILKKKQDYIIYYENYEKSFKN